MTLTFIKFNYLFSCFVFVTYLLLSGYMAQTCCVKVFLECFDNCESKKNTFPGIEHFYS